MHAPALLLIASLAVTTCGQEREDDAKEFVASIEISISPKIPVKRCSDERQDITCQLRCRQPTLYHRAATAKRPLLKCDNDDRLRKQMLESQSVSGYAGYIEYLLIRKGRTGKEMIVQERHQDNPHKLNLPIVMPLENLTTADDGSYYCKVVWHSYLKDRSWQSGHFKLNVYDCIDLTTEKVHAAIKETVTLNCIDVDVPMRWFKHGEDLDEDKAKLLNATIRERRHHSKRHLAHHHADHPELTLLIPGDDPSLLGPPGALIREPRQARPGGRTTTAAPTSSKHGRPITINSEDDAGIYSCKATFEDTQQIFTKETVVSIKTPPTSPTNIRTLKKSPHSLILRWEMKAVANEYIHAEPTFFTIFYRPIEGGQLLSKTVLKIPEVMLTGLKANTVYFVRIQAENELGTSPSASRIVVTPSANEMVEVDKRLLDMMNIHVKVLEQDLDSISNVLKEIVTDEENGGKGAQVEAPPAAPPTKTPKIGV